MGFLRKVIIHIHIPPQYQPHLPTSLTLPSPLLSPCKKKRLDAFYEFGVHAWDIAAAALLVEESGGVVVHPSGEELDLCGRKVMGGNKVLCEKMAAILSSEHPKF